MYGCPDGEAIRRQCFGVFSNKPNKNDLKFVLEVSREKV